jgi:hypothetical protein
MTDGSIRASDNDRERVVAALREAFSEGRLSLDEFDERSSAAYAAKTWGDLRELTGDLPSPPILSTQTQSTQTQSAQQQSMRVPALPETPVSPMSSVGSDVTRTVPHRPRPFGRLLPVVFVWALIAAAAGSAHLAAVLAVVFVAALAIRTLSGTRW